jgi:cytochrome c oxidase subunit II
MSAARRAGAALLLAAARAASAAPRPERGFGLPHDASLDGHRVDWLIHFTIVALGLIFLAVLAVLRYAAVRHRGTHPATYDHGNTRRGALLVLGCVAVVFFVVDGNLFLHSVADLGSHFWNFKAAEASPRVVRIEVNAHQWAWTVRYPGPDGKFNTPDDIVAMNEIHVPVRVPVVVQLAATDVIHSLYLPNFRVKQDAVPGSITRLWFQAQEEGDFEFGCAQHCGVNHYKMRGVLTAMAPEAYDRWLAAEAADARRGFDTEDAEAHWGWAWKEF